MIWSLNQISFPSQDCLSRCGENLHSQTQTETQTNKNFVNSRKKQREMVGTALFVLQGFFVCCLDVCLFFKWWVLFRAFCKKRKHPINMHSLSRDFMGKINVKFRSLAGNTHIHTHWVCFRQTCYPFGRTNFWLHKGPVISTWQHAQ